MCYEDDVTSATPTGNVHLVFAVDNHAYVKPDIWIEHWIQVDKWRCFVSAIGEGLCTESCWIQRIADHAGKRTDAWYPAVTARCGQDGALPVTLWLEYAFAKDLGHEKRCNDHHGLRTSIHGNSSRYDRTLRSWVGCMFVNVTAKRVLGIRPTCFTQS
jgi:hypothetical protein